MGAAPTGADGVWSTTKTHDSHGCMVRYRLVTLMTALTKA